MPDPANKATRAHAVRARLEEDIVMGLLMPGTRLDEKTIAERFDISRTPVREALQQLVSTGLAVRQPYRGVVVAQISHERLDALFEAMAEIEAICGRMASQRMTTSERAELMRLHEELAAASTEHSKPGYERLNEAFHEVLYRGAHNEVLFELAQSIRRQLSPYRRYQFHDPERIRTSFREHEAILQAIIERNADAAENHLRKHLMSAAAASIQRLRERSDQSEKLAGSKPMRADKVTLREVKTGTTGRRHE